MKTKEYVLLFQMQRERLTFASVSINFRRASAILRISSGGRCAVVVSAGTGSRGKIVLQIVNTTCLRRFIRAKIPTDDEHMVNLELAPSSDVLADSPRPVTSLL